MNIRRFVFSKAMASRAISFSVSTFTIWALEIVQGQKWQRPNQGTFFGSSENTISTGNNNLSRKGGYLHGGIIAIIVLGCVVSLTVLVGICITAGYLGKRKVVEYIFEREKFEESSFEMLDLELIPMPERTHPMKRDITSTSKCERGTAI